jgi:hypothetical protein
MARSLTARLDRVIGDGIEAAVRTKHRLRLTDFAGDRFDTQAHRPRRRSAGAPPTHHLLAMPEVSRRSRRLLGPLEGLVDDG